VYDSLSPEERAEAAICAENYGQAGAIDLYGPALGLPPAISRHWNYYYWGPRGYSGEIVFTLGASSQGLKRYFGDVKQVAYVRYPYAMPYENFAIFLCREPKRSLQEIWPELETWN
jgi:hypothetical protein